MLLLTPRVLSTKFPKSAVPSASVFVRSFASKIEEQGVAATGNLPPPKADPKEYGVNPDTIEHSWGFERKMIIARLMGDDRYEPKVFYRADKSTYDYPNLVPVHLDERLVMCECAPDNHYYVEFYIRKDGKPKRCKCGHWFKAIEADPESV